jgi:hypothetical protein
MRMLVACQTGMVLMPLMMIGAYDLLRIHAYPTFIYGISFGVLSIIAGIIGGMQFPIAAAMQTQFNTHRYGEGILYSADLAGSSTGALVTSLVLIPLMGFTHTLIAISAANALCVLLLIRTPRLRQTSFPL